MKTMRLALLVLALLSTAFGTGFAQETPPQPRESVTALKEFSYYPKDYAWERFWQNCAQAKTAMDADLDKIQALGANTVRIFLVPHAMGYPALTNQSKTCFNDVLVLIAAHNLKAHVNLFDCWESWTEIASSKAWLDAVVLPRKDDPRIALWELRNEAGLDKAPIKNWVQVMFPYLKQQAGSTPATVSVSKVEWLQELKTLTGSTPPDVYSLHWYPGTMSWTGAFPTVIDSALAVVPKEKLLIGEVGLSTYAYSDASQLGLFNDVFYYAGQKGITSLGVWTLNDFPAGTAQCGGYMPKAEEWYFGLYRTDGASKPAESVVREGFHGSYPTGLRASLLLNPSFEGLNFYSKTLDNWWPWDEKWTGEFWGTQDCAVAHSGKCSALLTADGMKATGLYTSPALPVTPGRPYSAEAYVLTSSLTGWARITLSWFKASGEWIEQTTSEQVTDANLTQWKLIRAGEVTAPADASSVQVHIQMYSSDTNSRVWFDDVRLVSARVYLPAVRGKSAP